MKKILIVFYSLLLFNLFINALFANKPVRINQYKMDISVEGHCVNVVLDMSIDIKDKMPYLLFNQAFQINELLIEDKPVKYYFSNDTLFFDAKQKKVVLHAEYTIISKLFIPSDTDYKLIPSSLNPFQILLERYYKWYPLLYNNFANYDVRITVPDSCFVFCFAPVDSIEFHNGKSIYYSHLFEEDFPVFITTSSCYQKQTFQVFETTFNFYFLPSDKRFLKKIECPDTQFLFTDSVLLKDSLLGIIINRVLQSYEWYSKNLWKQEIKEINIIEAAKGLGGFGLNSLILLNSDMIDYDLLRKNIISHEIAHLWIGLNTKYESKGRFFMSESLNEYVNLLFYESMFGEEALNDILMDYKFNRVYKNRPEYITISFSEVLKSRKQDSNIAEYIIYSKAPLFIHKFRQLIGKDKFLGIIKDTYNTTNQFITLKNFEKNIKKHHCWKAYKMLYKLEKQ